MDPLFLIIIGVGLIILLWLSNQSVKYYTKISPKLMQREIEIKQKIDNNMKLTTWERFHMYSYKVWYATIKAGFLLGIVLVVIGVFMKLFFKQN